MTPAKTAMAALGTVAVAGAVAVGVIATRPPAPSSHASASAPGGGTAAASRSPASTSTAAPSAAAVVAAAPLPDPSCQQEPSLKSISFGTRFDLKFVNNTNETLQTLWLDYAGKRVFYRQIPAGTGYVQQTFITHPWIVADLKGTCLTLYVTDGKQTTVTVPVGSVAAAPPGAPANAGASLGTPVAVIQATDALVFAPTSADVRVGDIVEWDNTGSIGHKVTFNSAAAAASNDLTFSAGDKWQVRFPTAGTYAYMCTLHTGMTGTITVH